MNGCISSPGEKHPKRQKITLKQRGKDSLAFSRPLALEEVVMELHFHEGQLKRRAPDWRAAIVAGVIAATVLMCSAIGVIIANGGSLWGAIRMVAAIAMGDGVFVESVSHDIAVLLVALTVHLALAIGYSFVLAALIEVCNVYSDLLMTLIVGAVFGAFLYLVNFYVMTAVFAWFIDARTWTNFSLHILYGLVNGISYVQISRLRKSRYARPVA
jgi:hypothetical protein